MRDNALKQDLQVPIRNNQYQATELHEKVFKSLSVENITRES